MTISQARVLPGRGRIVVRVDGSPAAFRWVVGTSRRELAGAMSFGSRRVGPLQVVGHWPDVDGQLRAVG